MWISVKDKLPNSDRDVIAIDDAGYVQRLRYSRVDLNPHKQTWHHFNCAAMYPFAITHWMELPKVGVTL